MLGFPISKKKKKKMAGFPIFHGFPLGQQSDVVLRTVVGFQLHFFLHNLIWTDKCRQHMRIHLLKQNICPELKFSKYLIYFYWKWFTVLKSAQNRRKSQNSVFAETEYVILLVHLRASQNMFWNFHNPAFFWFIGVYVVFQDFDQKSPKKIPIYCSL